MINSFSQYLVEEERVVYFTFGRMNPPTTGHGKLLDVLGKSGAKPKDALLQATVAGVLGKQFHQQQLQVSK